MHALRHRIAAAYQRSGWARAAVLLCVLAVFWAGMLALLLVPMALQPVLFVAWLLALATSAAWYLFPDTEP